MPGRDKEEAGREDDGAAPGGCLRPVVVEEDPWRMALPQAAVGEMEGFNCGRDGRKTRRSGGEIESGMGTEQRENIYAKSQI